MMNSSLGLRQHSTYLVPTDKYARSCKLHYEEKWLASQFLHNESNSFIFIIRIHLFVFGMIAMFSQKSYGPNDAPKGSKYKILDTEGQPRFHTFVTDPSTSCLQTAEGVIVCYDVTNRASYESMLFVCLQRDGQTIKHNIN